jgi:hyperosmotically inducible periplasmic protein
MQIERKVLLLGAALSLLAAGCGNRQEETPVAAATTTVGTEIDDTVVTAKVKSALLADADIKSFDLKVETRKGAVQLSGFVDNQSQIDQAIDLTRKVEGVANVGNEMSIKK